MYFNFVYLFSVLVFFVGDFWWSHLGISGRVPKVPAPKELKEPMKMTKKELWSSDFSVLTF